MAYNSNTFVARGNEIVKWLEAEFGSIRTGRATPVLLDMVQVESYGMKVPLQQVGGVNVEDARTLRISVWDQSAIKAVEKGIIEADLGVSVVADGTGVRVIFPELTGERRIQLTKLAKAKLEEARVSVRGAREDAIKEVEREEKAGEISQDEKNKAKEDIQKHVDSVNRKLEELLAMKEAEINQ